jgi:hypothetical protein
MKEIFNRIGVGDRNTMESTGGLWVYKGILKSEGIFE